MFYTYVCVCVCVYQCLCACGGVFVLCIQGCQCVCAYGVVFVCMWVVGCVCIDNVHISAALGMVLYVYHILYVYMYV